MRVDRVKDLYADLSDDQLMYVNCLGEPFFRGDAGMYTISLESGQREKSPGLMSLLGNDYFTAQSLKDKWEAKHGILAEGMYLKPIIPFILGGEMQISNMTPFPLSDLLDHHRDFRAKAKQIMTDPMRFMPANKRTAIASQY